MGCLFVFAMAFVGCSKAPYELAEVRGTVTLDGQPFTKGTVLFSPIAQDDVKKTGKPAYAELAADGKFTLSTYAMNDGAVVGPHRASIMNDKDSNTKKRNARSGPRFDFLEILDRTFEVRPGEANEFAIELTSDYVKRYGQRDD